jgi:hypothetical protein
MHFVRKILSFSVKHEGINLLNSGRYSFNLEHCTCEDHCHHKLIKYRASKPWLSTPPETDDVIYCKMFGDSCIHSYFYVLVFRFYINFNLSNFNKY